MASIGLGSIPAGMNPFTYYQAVLTAALYRQPPKWFSLRLWLLFGLMGVMILFSIAYFIALRVDGRRPHQPKTMWLFRLAQKQSGGGYIVTNAKLMTAVWTFAAGCVMLGSLNDLRGVILEEGTFERYSGWRSFYTLPLLIQGESACGS